MTNPLKSHSPLGLKEFLAALQTELGDYRIDSVTVDVDSSSALTISAESPRKVSVYLSRTATASADSQPDVVAVLPASSMIQSRE